MRIIEFELVEARGDGGGRVENFEPPASPLSVDSSARNVATETTGGVADSTVTVVLALLALVPAVLASVKVNVVGVVLALGVKISASSSLVIAAAVPVRR